MKYSGGEKRRKESIDGGKKGSIEVGVRRKENIEMGRKGNQENIEVGRKEKRKY